MKQRQPHSTPKPTRPTAFPTKQPSPPRAVIVNGELFTGAQINEQAKIGVFDRGFLYGDSLYEVVRTYGGRPFAMTEHLRRLEVSARLCRMELRQPLAAYASEMERAISAFRSLEGQAETEAYCRIIVSRGLGKIGFGKDCLESPTQVVIIAQPLNPPGPEQYERGFRYRVVDRLRNHPRALDPAMKSGNYLNSLLAFLESAEEGFDDAILCDGDGHVTEGTTFNIFYVKNNVVCTPPLGVGILEGITRALTLELSRGLGLPTREVRFPKQRLLEADEVFMTSTIKEVFPVTQVDGRRLSDGKPGPVTRQLTKAFRAEVARRLGTPSTALAHRGTTHG